MTSNRLSKEQKAKRAAKIKRKTNKWNKIKTNQKKKEIKTNKKKENKMKLQNLI